MPTLFPNLLDNIFDIYTDEELAEQIAFLANKASSKKRKLETEEDPEEIVRQQNEESKIQLKIWWTEYNKKYKVEPLLNQS